MLAVAHCPGKPLLDFDKAWDVRQIRHIVVACGYDNRVELFLPPPVLFCALCLLAESQNPGPALLLGFLNGGVELDEPLVAALREDIFDPLADHAPVPERCSLAVSRKGLVGENLGKRLLCEAHGRRRQVTVQIVIHASVGEPQCATARFG
jgi:hypothetical protein